MRRWRVLAALGVWAALVVALWVSDARPAALVLGGVVAVLATAVLSVAVGPSKTVTKISGEVIVL